MSRYLPLVSGGCPPLLVTFSLWLIFTLPTDAAEYTRLERLPQPQITGSSEAYPGGQFEARDLFDANPNTEYASNGKGTNTFVEVDFGKPVSIRAVRHLDRNDAATISSSQFTFLDGTGKPVSTNVLQHVNQRGGESLLLLPTPILAQRAKWEISSLGGGFSTVGGAELAFYSAVHTDAIPSAVTLETHSMQLLEQKGGKLIQWIQVQLDSPYAEPSTASLQAGTGEPVAVALRLGHQTVELPVPAVSAETPVDLQLRAGEQRLMGATVAVRPVRKLEVFLLPHSHVDIGYTALQADVEKKQNANIETGIRLAQATGDYPSGARFKWNVEVLWPVENYLRKATPEKQDEFIAAVRSGQIGLDAFYGNVLTGLCRPEELLNLMGYATRLSRLCGVPIESAMISDVPGYTWGTVSAMAQAGVKYFSFAPNYFDRMGGTMKEWQNRPFWWVGPDGRDRVLCWCPSRGYALGHIIGDGDALARFLPAYLNELETNSYPYDLTYLRWNVHGDNGSPDEKVADVVRDWNARYIYPHLVLSTTADAFREFERRYGNYLPQFRGDYTPYWEDGAASSALETAMNRGSAERLVQAEGLWAMLNPGRFPAEAFQQAWANILLYSEHTWGAHNSISQPDLPFVLDQWKVKREFALKGQSQSQALLAEVLESGPDTTSTPHRAIPDIAQDVEVLNTSSWPRTDLVTLPAEWSRAGDRVVDENFKPTRSQRLASSELAFLAQNVPPFGSKRFRVLNGPPINWGARAAVPRLQSSDFFVRVNEGTGTITNLFSRKLARELVQPESAGGLNSFFYLPGSDLKGLQSSGPPTVRVLEPGPLVASLLIESTAPGCRGLTREVRVIEGLDRVELINTIDKLPVRTKEGIHFGYGFNIPRGTMRMDVGWAAVRPELDQIPAACKNWFSVQRWVDISNERFGVTWSSVDAPLVEVGSITANLVGSQTDPNAWIQHLEPAQTFYSWVMNNHWHTNYRADQEGPTVFRYAIHPHLAFAPDEAARFGTACSQPLLVRKLSFPRSRETRLRLSSDKVLVSAFKPSDDGLGWIVRLYGAAGSAQSVRLAWSEPRPTKVWLSNLSEERGESVSGSVQVPGWGIVTLRAE
jgi:alpha-mannosidase